MKNEILLIPDKNDRERDRLAEVWKQNGGEVIKIAKFWIKPETGNKRVAIYGYDSFCLVLAQVLEIELIMPKDEMIAQFEHPFLKRKVEILSPQEISSINFPKFIKPVKPKLFKAQIFNSEEVFKSIIGELESDELLICSDIIKVNKEVRSFILDREIKDLAFYEGKGLIDEPKVFIETFLNSCQLELPKSFVLDVGYNEQDGWFIIELNSCWGAGLNFCSPELVVECIREAAINKP